MTEQEAERERIKVVFCLGGGELCDPGEDPDFPFRDWYDGVPHYIDTREMYGCEWEYRTAITYELFGQAPDPAGWERVQRFNSSGEAVCWCVDNHMHWQTEGDPDCPLCEGDGLVYLGDGEGETIYRRRLEATTSTLCRSRLQATNRG